MKLHHVRVKIYSLLSNTCTIKLYLFRCGCSEVQLSVIHSYSNPKPRVIPERSRSAIKSFNSNLPTGIC